MSKILVTGGAGFIGSNLAEELMRDNEVVIFDDFSTGSFDNIQNIKFSGKVVKGDIMESNQLNQAIKENGIEQIYHLAAISSSQMFDKNLKKSLKTNINGTINVFEAAKRNGIKRVVYASTSTIYAGLTPPFSEYVQVTPKNFYAFTKLVNELTGFIYSKEGILETAGLRFFSVYGPNEEAKGKYANVLTQFLIGMNKDEQPIIYGDGKQTRDFIYVKDLCNALILAMNTPKISGEVFNVGSGIKTSILDLVNELNMVLGKNIQPVFASNPITGYVFDHQASTIKTEGALGFKINTLLSDGLKKMKRFYCG